MSDTTVWGIIAKDPFLGYESQNEEQYQVQTTEGHQLTIPKKRAVAAPYPNPHSPFKLPDRLLTWAALGLFSAGLVTILVAPLVIWQSSKYLGSVHGRNLIICAAILFVVGFILSSILLIHFIYR